MNGSWRREPTGKERRQTMQFPSPGTIKGPAFSEMQLFSPPTVDGTHWFANGRFEVWKTSHLSAFFEL